MGTLVQKVTEMEKKYDELSKAKDSSDSVCENMEKEMYTAPGRGEEDNLSSISAASRREERVSTDSKKKGFATGGSKEEDSAGESDLCVTFQGPEEDVFALLEADLEKRRTGWEACRRKACEHYQKPLFCQTFREETERKNGQSPNPGKLP